MLSFGPSIKVIVLKRARDLLVENVLVRGINRPVKLAIETGSAGARVSSSTASHTTSELRSASR